MFLLYIFEILFFLFNINRKRYCQPVSDEIAKVGFICLHCCAHKSLAILAHNKKHFIFM